MSARLEPRPAMSREAETRAEPSAAASRPFETALVAEVASLLSGSDLTEIEVEKGDLRIRVVRTPAAIVHAPHAAASPSFAFGPPPSAAPPAAAEPAPVPAKDPDALTSPMVGTAYRRPSPGAKTFVEIGSTVRAGEKLLLIEAMKTFNDIVAPRAGTIRAIYVEDGQPVEYGEPLIVIG